MNQGAVAIVTGASGGFGREFVKLLLRQADVSEVWAIARDEGKLKRLAAGSEGKVRIFPMDLTDRTCFAEIERQLKQSRMPVKYLINNAGFAKFCSYGDLSVGESLNMIDLNVGAVVALGLTCIPYMARAVMLYVKFSHLLSKLTPQRLMMKIWLAQQGIKAE